MTNLGEVALFQVHRAQVSVLFGDDIARLLRKLGLHRFSNVNVLFHERNGDNLLATRSLWSVQERIEFFVDLRFNVIRFILVVACRQKLGVRNDSRHCLRENTIAGFSQKVIKKRTFAFSFAGRSIAVHSHNVIGDGRIRLSVIFIEHDKQQVETRQK